MTKLHVKEDYRVEYKTDGIVRNNNGSELKLLETVGAFKKDDDGKVALDNSKGMFALLAMLKTVTDKYSFASLESFKKPSSKSQILD